MISRTRDPINVTGLTVLHLVTGFRVTKNRKSIILTSSSFRTSPNTKISRQYVIGLGCQSKLRCEVDVCLIDQMSVSLATANVSILVC